MPFEVSVIERNPVPEGRRFWDVVRGILPRVTTPTAQKMQARAPKGRSHKLSRRVDVRVVPVNQGIVQGVEAQFVVAVPYGHLVARGHRIVGRGPQRKGLPLSRAERASRRSALKLRRVTATGFVPPNPFALASLAEDRAQIVTGIEQGLRDAL
jgi:hypothetical protein